MDSKSYYFVEGDGMKYLFPADTFDKFFQKSGTYVTCRKDQHICEKDCEYCSFNKYLLNAELGGKAKRMGDVKPLQINGFFTLTGGFD